MVRLFRGEGDFVDSVNGYNLDQTYSTTSTPNAGITFLNATPYGTQERQVMHFSRQGKKYGDGTGLPTGNQSRSMAAWVRWESVDPYGGFMGLFGYGRAVDGKAWYLFHYWTGGLNLDYWEYDEGINPIYTIYPGIWYHVTITWDGTNNKAYINGNLVKTGAPNVNPNTEIGRVVLGGSPNIQDGEENQYWHDDSSSWDGDLADVAFFNRALSDAEVSSIFTASEGLEAPFALGETCANASDCDSGYCAGTVCVDGAIGSTCDLGENADCASNYCGGDSLCTDGSNGSSCSIGSSCSSGSCAGNNQCTDGALSSPCGSGSDCTSGYCVSNQCTDGAINSVCASGNDCSSGYCVSNQCTDGAINSVCASGHDCSSGYCVSNQCTVLPSDEPSDIPSDIPSSVPFDEPSDIPSDIPSLAPSSLPSSMPSSFPSFFSSSEPSWLPSNLSGSIILDPCHGITCSNHGKCKGKGICHCENTFIQIKDGKDCGCPHGTFLNASTNRCYTPTSSPTLSPVSVPVTPLPTSVPVTSAPSPDKPVEDDSCEDITNTFTVNNKEIDCDWLSRNKKREQKRKDIYCALNEVKMACPVTCDFCNCMDDASYTFRLKSGKDKVTCSWISKNKSKIDKRRSKYCVDEFDDGALVNACTKSCGLCAN